jgi:hypothetical protein
MLPQKFQIVFTLIVGLLIGFIMDQPARSTPPPTSVLTPLASPAPFVTRGNVLLITATLRREAAPTIKQIAPLDQGRITATTSGNYSLTLLDASNASLYQLNFQPNYLSAGEPPELLNEVTLTFVIPSMPNMKRVVLATPNGVVTQEIAP